MGKNGTTERAMPEAFLLRMKSILGDGYAAFLSASDAPPVRGLRVNPAVCAGTLADLPIRAIPGLPGGAPGGSIPPFPADWERVSSVSHLRQGERNERFNR